VKNESRIRESEPVVSFYWHCESKGTSERISLKKRQNRS